MKLFTSNPNSQQTLVKLYFTNQESLEWAIWQKRDDLVSIILDNFRSLTPYVKITHPKEFATFIQALKSGQKTYQS